MKTILTALLLMVVLNLKGQLHLLLDKKSQPVFGGGTRTVEMRWQNAGREPTNAEISALLIQLSSTTAVPLGETRWKNLMVLPGQTVLESARLDFPNVNAPTRFILRWTDGKNQILGQTEVLAWPTNLLGELKTLLSEETFGVLDPDNQFKPVLKQNGLVFADLEESPLDEFHGRLVLVDAPKKSPADARRLSAPAVWILPPTKRGAELTPSFYVQRTAKNVAVFVQLDLLANFSENPQAQLNLVSLCKLALRSACVSNSIPETSTDNSP